MLLTDIFMIYSLKTQTNDRIRELKRAGTTQIVENQIYSDETLITIYRDGSIVITRCRKQPFKIFPSAAKYFHKTRKIRREIKNETHWLYQFGEYFADKHSEKVMKYYLDRKKPRLTN